jgi:hypothetical protein
MPLVPRPPLSTAGSASRVDVDRRLAAALVADSGRGLDVVTIRAAGGCVILDR